MTIEALSDFGYTEVEVVGSGGLGDVYRARRVSTGGFVAIKVVREQVDRESTERRVRRELEALLKLKGHPNVVQIEELVSLPSGLALVMEFVNGGSLMDALRQNGPFETTRALAAAIDTARALTDAHSLGIVHRDIKPHNVMVGQFGHCKVCDFGIASMFKDSAYTDRTSALSYRYASPEEIEDEAEVGPETDIYSLGITLRQLLTGETSAARAAAALTELESDQTHATHNAVRRSLLDLVTAMTSRTPADRPTASAVLDRLRDIERSLGTSQAPPPPPPSAAPMADEPDDRTVVRPSRQSGQPNAPVAPSARKPLPSPGDAPERWWT